MVALVIATILAVGVEIGSINILTTFLVELRGFAETASKIGLIVLLVGVAVGRLLVGILTHKKRLVVSLLGLLGLSGLFMSGLFFLPLDGWLYPAIFLAGLALSAILPLIITLAGLLFPDMAGTALGIIKTAMPIGGILLPFLMSLVAEYGSFQLSLLLFPLACLLAFAVLFWQIQPHKATQGTTSWSVD
ncbi:MAG: MFS transporter [Anaerolineales bacterium]|nr:MFS transporter [Anaerolineales bacterium]